ncbi:MAG: glycosyltransferase family 39 protein [Methanobrevibacter sp.]|nr:glycosyltransferase family 39 protein [Candidatus Methanovirga meridionalis]
MSNILKNGVPLWLNLPVAYYLLAPFAAISGSSIIGIKIGISFYGSLMAVLAYFICKDILGENSSKIPPTVAAFLMVVNVMYFTLIEDLIQNLIGTLLFLIFLYVFIKWLNNIKNKKYGLITFILICLNVFTHIYTGALTVAMFVLIFILFTVIKAVKIKKLPTLEIKILSIFILMALAILPIMFLLYPPANDMFLSLLSFLSGEGSLSNGMGGMGSSSINYILTIPFILGLILTLKIFIDEFKKYLNGNDIDNFSKKGIVSLVYLTLSSILVLFSLLQSEFQMRFGLLLFVVIAFVTPISLYFLENLIKVKYPLKKTLNFLIIGIIAILFISSSVYATSGQFSNLSPSITEDQYNSLFEIKEKYLDNITHPAVILVDEYHGTYWTQYVFNQDIVISDNQSTAKEKYNESNFFKIDMDSGGMGDNGGDSGGMGGGIQVHNDNKTNNYSPMEQSPNNESADGGRPPLNNNFSNNNDFNEGDFGENPLSNDIYNSNVVNGTNSFKDGFKNMNLWNPFFPYPFLIGFNLFDNTNEFHDLNNRSLDGTNDFKRMNGTNDSKRMNGGFGVTKSNEESNGTLLFNQSSIRFYKLDL